MIRYQLGLTVKRRHQPSLYAIVEMMTSNNIVAANALQEIITFVSPKLFQGSFSLAAFDTTYN
jgi:hypothetical protein